MVFSFLCKTSIQYHSFSHTQFLLFLFVIFLYSPRVSTFAAKTSYGNETDRLSLLAIKAKIIDDPFGVVKGWNDSVHFCSWEGVVCGRRHQRVTVLNLSSYDLLGSLSPAAGNLTFLSKLVLNFSRFQHQIPQELGRLNRLTYLELSNNSFSGEIPANISGCSRLVWLRLGFNKLSGKIPSELGSMQKLERVQLHHNNLSGPIPASLGNISTARSLSLALNSLEGHVPNTLGQLKNLEYLGLGANLLSGTIPLSIYNLSSIARFTVPYNKLEGTLPSDLAFSLPKLIVLNIGHNQFSGPLPASLSNASNLVELDTSGTKFTGKLTIDFSGSPNLWWLVLVSSSLGTGEADDLKFFESLTRCKNLRVMDLSDNQFGGGLPSSISNLSSLVTLRLGSNQLSGTIPEGIGNLVNLTEFEVQDNSLSGRIPLGISKLKMLQRLDMSENSFSGNIISSLANLTKLFSLHLQNNHFSGPIPSSIGNNSNLQELDLSRNYLNGTLPKRVMGLSSLTISLNLAQNRLTGSLPSEVRNLKNLNYLDVSNNKLSGSIPPELGSCLSLERLHLEGNFFEGTIPQSFSSLRGLEDLDLSRNNLSGQIPEYFQRMSFMKLNLSFNHFQGQVPTEGVFKNATAISLEGNEKLCGGIFALHFPACAKSKKGKTSQRLKLVIPLLSGLLLLVTIFLVAIIIRLRKLKREPSSAAVSSNKDLLLNVSYESLLRATNGFSSANLIGSGGFGSVYKGILDPNETVVAIKVLRLHERGALKSFLAECEALRNIRHRNLVKVLTACSSLDFRGNEFKALVYEFMPNGSLEDWLHPSEEANADGDLKMLSLLQRLHIAIDVASALDYLHNHCGQPIVHCDLKPSNILLDNDLTARVSDFGLARFIPGAASQSQLQQSSSAGLKGTVGYAAPEYGMGGKVSKYGDVYSYGILLLEMFTAKRPTDEMFRDGLTLHRYVKMALQRHISEVLDPHFVFGGEEEEAEEEVKGREISSEGQESKKDKKLECLAAILEVGIVCSMEMPRERMDIGDVVKELKLVRSTLIGS